MISYEEALTSMAQLPKLELAVERVILSSARGRVLAEEVTAPFASPLFTNSAMDGFAFKWADFNSREQLTVTQDIYAGANTDKLPPQQQPGECVKIMTGAPLPEWADTVIPVERATVKGGKLSILGEVQVGANIRTKGEDIQAGQKLFSPGTWLQPEHLMVLANFGIDQVTVQNKPSVSIFSTGNELLELGEALRPGGIYNSSRYFLEASLQAYYGITPHMVATLPDIPTRCADVIAQAIGNPKPDLIVTTGAVSAGDKDFIPQLASDLGFEPLFHKVAVRPGKPIFVARHPAGKLWVGLPGNPISTTTGWHFFIRPMLAKWAGLPLPRIIKANNINDIQKPEGLTCFFRAQYQDGFVKALPNQGSAHLLASTQANAYIVLPRSVNMISSGTCVDVQII